MRVIARPFELKTGANPLKLRIVFSADSEVWDQKRGLLAAWFIVPSWWAVAGQKFAPDQSSVA
jgi:hypothetical protein